MNNKELIYEIINKYEEARKSKYPHKNITRIKSHTTSSNVEDLIAFYFTQFTKHEILIDPLFSYESSIKNKTFRPDIVVKDEEEIKSFFDVKMDLGWKRSEFHSYCIAKSEMIKKIAGDKISYNKKDIKVSKNAKYEIVVISEKNISEKKLNENLSLIQNANIEKEVSIFFLTNTAHPNDGKQKATNNIVLNENHFNKLTQRIKSL